MAVENLTGMGARHRPAPHRGRAISTRAGNDWPGALHHAAGPGRDLRVPPEPRA